MFKRKITLFKYLLGLILFSSILVLLIVFFTNRRLMSQMIFTAQNDMFRSLTQASIDEMATRFHSVEELVRYHCQLMKDGEGLTRIDTKKILQRALDIHDGIFGAEIIISDEYHQKKKYEYHALYAWRVGDKIQITDRSDIEADYQTDWYQLPFKSKEEAWCEPYLDPQPNTLMVTFSMPVLDKEGHVEAVVTADLSLDWLKSLLNSLPLGQSGEPLLLSASQTFLMCGQEDWILRETLHTLSTKDPDPENKEVFKTLAKEFQQSSNGSIRFRHPVKKETAWCYYQKLERNGLTIGCILPEKQVFQMVYEMNRWMIYYGVLGTILLIFPSYWIASSVASPLAHLSEAATELAHGNFSAKLPSENRNLEISNLIGSFDHMRDDLKRYIVDITESAKTREYMNAQLKVAHQIQLGMVPKSFLDMAKYNIELFAMMEPALNVGGDLYDFAVFDGHHFYFCIGDVSGKGIPASLFMALGKTLMRSAASTERDPARVMQRVNRELVEYNDAALFITAFCGVLDLHTNELVYSCAGHNPPVIIEQDGTSRYLTLTPDLPLAIDADAVYNNFSMKFEPGDRFFLYTDGVTEAMNKEGGYLGEPKLLDILHDKYAAEVDVHVQQVMSEIHSFASGTEQSDDITLIMFQRH